MALEIQDLEQLAYPFPVNAHKFLNGLVYLTEDPVNQRLDSVDPSWSWNIIQVLNRDNAVTVHGRLTIKGVSRDGIGMAVVQLTKDGSKEANEAEKSAVSDALKRAARLFGIGRYILAMGKAVTNGEQLTTWLNQHYPQNASKQVDIPDNLDPDTHLGESPDNWLILLKKLTLPFYGVEKHQDASINHHLNDTGMISREMTADTAAAYLFNHRMAKDFGFGDTEIKAAFGSSFGNWLKKNPRNYAKAWEIAQNYHAHLEQMPD